MLKSLERSNLFLKGGEQGEAYNTSSEICDLMAALGKVNQRPKPHLRPARVSLAVLKVVCVRDFKLKGFLIDYDRFIMNLT